MSCTQTTARWSRSARRRTTELPASRSRFIELQNSIEREPERTARRRFSTHRDHHTERSANPVLITNADHRWHPTQKTFSRASGASLAGHSASFWFQRRDYRGNLLNVTIISHG